MTKNRTTKLQVVISEDDSLREFVKDQIKAAVLSISRSELATFISDALGSVLPKSKDAAEKILRDELVSNFKREGLLEGWSAPSVTSKFRILIRGVVQEFIHEVAREIVAQEIKDYKWWNHADVDKIIRDEVKNQISTLMKLQDKKEA